MTIRITTNFDNLDQLVSDVSKKIASDMFGDLVLNTPVDTGALRKAWELDLDGSTPSIKNPLPYARRLMQDGYSEHAPAGTLDQIIDRHTNRGK